MTHATAKALKTIYVAGLATRSALLGAAYSIYNTAPGRPIQPTASGMRGSGGRL
jgi:hypothetical protein